jgi:CHAT domain-containing protein
MFATHGLLGGDNEGIGEPALMLTPDLADSGDDGFLRASDVVALNIRADLVILSACSTVPSGEDGAEPLAGLASAFLIAGARTVVASYWTLLSAEAEDLTNGMVRAQQERQLETAFALRESAARLRGRANSRHPVYWAPLEVLGFPLLGR